MNWDYIVVGAGSSGCALAAELVRSGSKVLVIEAGGRDSSPYIRVAAGQVRACAAHDWGYQSLPDRTRNGRHDAWIRGRVLGGSSSINGTMYTRGAAGDFDRWNLPGWSWAEVLPTFRAMERSDQPGPLRGHAGPLYIRTVRRPHSVSRAFVESARAAGLAFNPDYNGETQDGVAYTQLTQRRGFRWSAADAFLKPVLRHPNLKLSLRTTVEKIELQNGRASGVCCVHDGKRYFETARDIVLCAGTINSPKLLMLSGIGDAKELEPHGIKVAADIPAVGRNLKEQPLISLIYKSKIPTYNLTHGWTQKLAFLREFLLHGEGPISNLFEAAAVISSSATQPIADLQLIFAAFGFEMGSDGLYKLSSYPSVMLHVMQSYPRSSGQIRLASGDAKDAPIIDCELLQDATDLQSLIDGIVQAREIMRQQPIASLLEVEVAPGADVFGRAKLEEYVRNHAGISYHPVGTCRMGFGTNAVVDPTLRVRGFDNLWVADASVIPEHMSANMNAVSIMVGKKLGHELAAIAR
jgi:choline dehydrogenase